ncbi:MAG: hypothetical protein U0168_10870 [Nannocystaceae bacterium]
MADDGIGGGGVQPGGLGELAAVGEVGQLEHRAACLVVERVVIEGVAAIVERTALAGAGQRGRQQDQGQSTHASGASNPRAVSRCARAHTAIAGHRGQRRRVAGRGRGHGSRHALG